MLISNHFSLCSAATYRYNSVFKVVYISSTAMILWYMKRHKTVKQSYDKDHDTFRYLFLILPCSFLALIWNERFTPFEVGAGQY